MDIFYYLKIPCVCPRVADDHHRQLCTGTVFIRAAGQARSASRQCKEQKEHDENVPRHAEGQGTRGAVRGRQAEVSGRGQQALQRRGRFHLRRLSLVAAPAALLIPLYEIIRQPITWQIFHGDYNLINQVTDALKDLPASGFDVKNAYWEMSAITNMPALISAIKAAAPEAAKVLEAANPVLTDVGTFTMFGINLSVIPQWQLWTINPLTWNEIGQFLIPVISAASTTFPCSFLRR